MNWLWVVIGAAVAVLILKMILKTLKIVFVFAIVAVLGIVYFLWQHGMGIPFK